MSNHRKETRASELLIINGKDTIDNMKAASENIRRQRYRVTKQGAMLVLTGFLCTQPQPLMYTIAGFALHLVLMYFIIVSTFDSYYDSLYQKGFRSQVE